MPRSPFILLENGLQPTPWFWAMVGFSMTAAVLVLAVAICGNAETKTDRDFLYTRVG